MNACSKAGQDCCTHTTNRSYCCAQQKWNWCSLFHTSHLSISGLGQCNLMEEIGCLTVKCVVYWEGVEWCRCLLEIDYLHFTITEEQVCQNRRTGPFTDYGTINPKQIGRLHAALLDANKCHHSQGWPCRRGLWWGRLLALWPPMHMCMELMALSFTLSGGLEVERLETPGERRGVNDIHTVFAAVLPVKHDGHYEDCHGDDAGSKTGVQSYIVGAVHTWNTQDTWKMRAHVNSNSPT